jgi:hypothetical protein
MAGMTHPARDARAFEPYLQHQAGTNGCGTTGLAMLLSFWLGRPGAFDRPAIDARIRCGPDPLAFTSPNHLVSYARSQGFRCRGINHGSWDQLIGLLDRGVPVLVLYDPTGDGHDMLLHYVVVVGYTEQPAGGVSTPVRQRNGTPGMTADIPLPEGDLGVSGFVAAVISDGINGLNPVQSFKNAWNRFF